jgi:hypothetical protein
MHPMAGIPRRSGLDVGSMAMAVTVWQCLAQIMICQNFSHWSFDSSNFCLC